MNVCRPLARLEVPEFRGPLDFDDLFDWLEASINIILTIMWSYIIFRRDLNVMETIVRLATSHEVQLALN